MTILETLQPTSTPHTTPRKTLSVAYSDDSDDIFNFYAWERGHITLPDCEASFRRHHISFMNHAAAAEIFDIVNISSVMYPSVADRYWILATGSSVGRGYGPMLVSKHHRSLADLKGKRIAVADISTTGGALAMMYCPEAEFIAKPYHQIADAVLSGEFDAGVMIHEELIYFPEKGLRLVCNLGQVWLAETGLPLPVGLNVVRKKHGRSFATEVQRTCRASLDWALTHTEEIMPYLSKIGRGCAEEFVPMFSNEDTLFMPEDVREGLALLFRRVVDLGLGPQLEEIEVIDG